MSAASAISLAFVSQQVVIYVGLFLFIVGIIGGPLVLIVFLSLRTFRQSSCAFYLIIMSIVNIVHLFTGLLTLIMIYGFNINWTNMSVFYCKFRLFDVQLCALMSLTYMCLAIIDQFLATCSNPRWHQWNNINLARYIIIGAVICWSLHGIPYLLFYDLILSTTTGQSICVVTNVIFQKYSNIFLYPVLSSALPTVTMMIFGILAYRNIQQIAYRTVPLVRRELDKQLTTMVLVQVFFDIFAFTPQVIFSINSLIITTPSDLFTITLLGFISKMTNLLYYLHFVSPFYIYMCVSKRFRQQLIYVLFTIHFKRVHPREIMSDHVEPQI